MTAAATTVHNFMCGLYVEHSIMSARNCHHVQESSVGNEYQMMMHFTVLISVCTTVATLGRGVANVFLTVLNLTGHNCAHVWL